MTFAIPSPCWRRTTVRHRPTRARASRRVDHPRSPTGSVWPMTDDTAAMQAQIDDLKLHVSNLEDAIRILVQAIEEVELHKKPHEIGVTAGHAIKKVTY